MDKLLSTVIKKTDKRVSKLPQRITSVYNYWDRKNKLQRHSDHQQDPHKQQSLDARL